VYNSIDDAVSILTNPSNLSLRPSPLGIYFLGSISRTHRRADNTRYTVEERVDAVKAHRHRDGDCTSL
jgi:hypothetical protein